MRTSPSVPLYIFRVCRNPGKNTAVILSEAKNLIITMSYKIEILRLTSQNDIMTQSLYGEGEIEGEVGNWSVCL